MIYTLEGETAGGPDVLVQILMARPPGSAAAILASNHVVATSEVAAVRAEADEAGLGYDDYLSTDLLAVLPGGRLVYGYVPHDRPLAALMVVGNLGVDIGLVRLRLEER